jgi:hypothetical protein
MYSLSLMQLVQVAPDPRVLKSKLSKQLKFNPDATPFWHSWQYSAGIIKMRCSSGT